VDISRIRHLVAVKSGREPVILDSERLAPFRLVTSHPHIASYLANCLPEERYTASGVGVCNLERLAEENLAEANPGCYIYRHGYLVVATSIGGNAICFHAPSGCVYWADHAGFSAGRVSYQDRLTGEWVDLEGCTDENVQRAVELLSENIPQFLEDLLTDRLTGRLDQLD